MIIEYTAAGIEISVLSSTSRAMKIASVPLCTPISIDEAMAWASRYTEGARHDVSGHQGDGAEHAGHQADVGEVVGDIVALVEQDAEDQDREDDRGPDPHRRSIRAANARSPRAHEHPDPTGTRMIAKTFTTSENGSDTSSLRS